MTSIEYWSGYDSMKRDETAFALAGQKPRTPMRLAMRFGSYVLVSRKKKGAGKGHKENYEWRWNDRRAYMDELRELSPRDYALLLCRDELDELLADTWWDVPGYRDEHIRAYRARIKAIRLEHGLSKSDVARFMRVA